MKLVRWTRDIGGHKKGDIDRIGDNDFIGFKERSYVKLIKDLGTKRRIHKKHKWIEICSICGKTTMIKKTRFKKIGKCACGKKGYRYTVVMCKSCKADTENFGFEMIKIKD